MNRFLKLIIHSIRTLLSYGSPSRDLTMTRVTERFDVVERVPVYVRVNPGFNGKRIT